MLAAALLFLAFIGGIGFNLLRGRRPDCHCFGQVHSAPAGWPTLTRNVGFMLMAAIIVGHGGRGPIDWFTDLPELGQIGVVFGVLLLALGAAQVWLLLRMWRQNQALLARLDSRPDGALPVFDSDVAEEDRAGFRERRAPAFDLPRLDGDRLTLDGLLAAGKPVLLLFVDPGCGPCRQLVPDIREWERRFGAEVSVALLSRGTEQENREKFGPVVIGLQRDRELYDTYGVEGTPTGVLVHPDGIIRDRYAPGQQNIRDLVVRTIDRRQSPEPPPPDVETLDPVHLLRLPTGPDLGARGTRLPLPDLDGAYVGLDDLRGERTVLLFWRPDCAFCQAMLPELREWEDDAAPDGTRLLIVSTGTDEENRSPGLRSRIVIDEGFTTGRAYGVTGTPSAILLDGQGQVASPLVAGSDAVLDLLYEQVEGPDAALVQVEG